MDKYIDIPTVIRNYVLKTMKEHPFHTMNKDTYGDDLERYQEDIYDCLKDAGYEVDDNMASTIDDFIEDNLVIDRGERYYSFRKVYNDRQKI